MRTATKTAAPAADVATPVPYHRIQFGLVRGSIWKDETADQPVLTLTLARVIRDAAKNERVEQTFQPSDVRHLCKVAYECARWIEWQEKRLNEEAKRPGPRRPEGSVS